MDNGGNFLKITITLENVKLNINTINNLKEHLKVLLSDNLITQNKFNDLMDKLKFLTTESNGQLKSLQILEQFNSFPDIDNPNSIDFVLIQTKIDTIKSNSIVISDELNKMIYEYGYTSISSTLNLLEKTLWEKNKINLLNKLSLIEKFFRVIKVDKKYSCSSNSKNDVGLKIKNISIDPVKKLPSFSKKNNIEINDFDSNDDEKVKINLIYELNKAMVEIELDDLVYILNGYFKEDTFNEIYQNEIFEIKYKNIQRRFLKNYENPDSRVKNFFREYMGQLSVKDFVVSDDTFIAQKIKNKYTLSVKMNRMSIVELLNEFVEKDLYHKRDIVILLLLDDTNLESMIDDFLIDKNISEPKENSESDDKITIKIIDVNNDSDDKNINDINGIDSNEVSNPESIEEQEEKNKNKTNVFKNPLPLVKFNKATATRYSINSIMKNFDSNNEMKNLTSVLANSKKILNANVLMDFLRNGSLKSNEYENFKNSIHWVCRKKIFAKSIQDTRGKTKEEELSWETKLSFMEISEKAKDKVNEKIKEVRTSRDNSKAESFIESFFKIPFGKFIKEDIFIKSSNSDIKMKKLVDRINLFITDKDKQIHVSNTLGQLKQKTLDTRLTHDIENCYLDLIEEKKKINKDKQDYLDKVDKILEDAIYGHKESKREIKRLVAQWMGGRMEGTVLGFYGPPGVGKTCFAKKGIAKCLFDADGNPRPFCILQLGGATDGSILEGHSYTYVGAKPGRLVEFLQETKCMNPIIYFDELDKVSETEKGKEIIDILIHLTDKSQNKELFDKYFSGIELDFSKCIIIFSYNDASKVNRILRDRITEIKINPLTKSDKLVITKRYTLKEISGELNYECELSDELVEYIIDTYTMEPGVRKLNEKLYEIFREINLRILENPFETIFIDRNLVDEILTRHYKVKHYKIHLKPQVGLINGLYASTIGLGGITLIQLKKILTTSTNIPLELTGQQGDVMKESMSCAKTLALNLLTNEERESISNEIKTTPFGLHIHCPDGATPKDGPSAGITITTGIYSILTNKPVRNDIAMTGEVDLLGNVKAIGGLDAKINGAIKAGVKLVIFPKENEQDWEKIVKEKALNGEIEIYMAETIDQVIAKAIIQ